MHIQTVVLIKLNFILMLSCHILYNHIICMFKMWLSINSWGEMFYFLSTTKKTLFYFVDFIFNLVDDGDGV